jgi:hypothetical protein
MSDPYGRIKVDEVVSSSGNTIDLLAVTTSNATASAKGYMSAADKVKLDAVEVAVPAAGGTFSGDVSFSADVDVNGVYTGAVTAMGALEIDCSSSNYFTKTISGNSTFTIANVPSGAFGLTLELTHTSGTVTWPASIKWPGDTAPTLTTGKTHLFFLVSDNSGTTFRGAALVDYTN